MEEKHDTFKEDMKDDQPEVEVIDKENNLNEETKVENDSNEETQEIEKKIEELEQEKDQAYNQMLRIQAEYDNFKKRTQKEKQSERKYKSEEMINELLPAIDNFERALQVEVTDETASFMEGMTMVYNQIKDAMANQGAEKIESVGQEFDPTIHHAVMQVEDDEHESNVVVEEMQPGYMLKDRVIRPAMVKVNK